MIFRLQTLDTSLYNYFSVFRGLLYWSLYPEMHSFYSMNGINTDNLTQSYDFIAHTYNNSFLKTLAILRKYKHKKNKKTKQQKSKTLTKNGAKSCAISAIKMYVFNQSETNKYLAK